MLRKSLVACAAFMVIGSAAADQTDDIRVVSGLVVAGAVCELDTMIATLDAIMDAVERNGLTIERVTELAEKNLMTMTMIALTDPVLRSNMCYEAGVLVEAVK